MVFLYFFIHLQLQNNKISKIPFRQINNIAPPPPPPPRKFAAVLSYKRQELLTLCEHLGLPPILVGSCRSLFQFLCCVFLFCFIFFLCLVCPMLPVSLDCPFLIVRSIFFNVNCITFQHRLKISYVVISYCT